MLCFPCNQFGKQEQGTNEEIGNFISGRLWKANFTIFEKCHVNGPYTHPVWHFCRYNSQETRNRYTGRPIPWNFAKFVIDRDGQVFKYYSPKFNQTSRDFWKADYRRRLLSRPPSSQRKLRRASSAAGLNQGKPASIGALSRNQSVLVGGSWPGGQDGDKHHEAKI